MNVIHPYRLGSEYCEDQELSLWWLNHSGLFLRMLTSPKYHRPSFNSSLTGNLLIYPPKCSIMERQMNGRKSKRNEPQPSNGNGKSLPFRWVNVPLTSEDIDFLEQQTADLELLAFDYIQLGMHGLGLSVKYDTSRKSYSVSIYRPSDAVHVQPIGISGSAPNLRDALLVSLYRFNHCLEGSFDNAPDTDDAVQPRRFW